MATPFKSSAIIGLGYGLVLFWLAFVVADYGHGTFTLVGVAGAPFSVLGIPTAMVATLCQWSFFVLAFHKTQLPKRYFIGFLLAHYVTAAALLLLPSSNFADWDRVPGIPTSYQHLLAFGFVWYLIGQLWIWNLLITGHAFPSETLNE